MWVYYSPVTLCCKGESEKVCKVETDEEMSEIACRPILDHHACHLFAFVHLGLGPLVSLTHYIVAVNTKQIVPLGPIV